MDEKRTVPVLLITGYLGSGKTTLLNKILKNKKGIKFAVIVNDLGEVNIDADLIGKGGIVDKGDDNLVALQNGCICCTLKLNLVKQISDLVQTGRFDYIVIEASGICEPEPIAQTICSIPYLGEEYTHYGTCTLDNIVTVVDALRLASEFGCGKSLTREGIEEEDIENLIISQIEFCNVILLNKASEVEREELGTIKAVLKALQPKAEIIECDYADVDLDKIVGTHAFNFDKTMVSAGWIRGIEDLMDDEAGDDDEAGEEDEYGTHHHRHNEGEADEYGISTFVYYRRPPFDINSFDHFIATYWPQSVIRCKGVVYFEHNADMSYLFEQAGVQKKLIEAGLWYATASKEEFADIVKKQPDVLRDWDEAYGDRMVKLVFIGHNMDKEEISRNLDECLSQTWEPGVGTDNDNDNDNDTNIA